MRKVILTLVFGLGIYSAKASDTLLVKIDTTTFKNIIYIVQTQIDSKSSSKYIIEALSKYQLIADKPKQLP